MKTLTIAASILLLISVPLSACGDKYLVRCHATDSKPGISALTPGSVLILMNKDALSMQWMEEHNVAEALSHAGHKVYLVSSDEKLEEVLATTPVDIVVVDVADANRIRAVVERLHNASVVPLVHKSHKDELERVAAEYPSYIKAATRESTFMGAVDIAIEDARHTT